MDMTCSTHGNDKKYIWNFGRKAYSIRTRSVSTGKSEVKVKLSLCFFLNRAPRVEGVLGSRVIAPLILILDLAIEWR